MRRVRFSGRARSDLISIWTWIAQRSPEAATRVTDLVEAAAYQLAEHPWLGHRHRNIANPRYSVFRVKSYLVVYRFTDNVLFVVRVVHGARNLQRIFRSR